LVNKVSVMIPLFNLIGLDENYSYLIEQNYPLFEFDRKRVGCGMK
jgi:hypothetical protein